jgi:hypothetical protein
VSDKLERVAEGKYSFGPGGRGREAVDAAAVAAIEFSLNGFGGTIEECCWRSLTGSWVGR